MISSCSVCACVVVSCWNYRGREDGVYQPFGCSSKNHMSKPPRCDFSVGLKSLWYMSGVWAGCRWVIDVGSEWRTFSRDKAKKNPSWVGDSQNLLLGNGDLSTMIGKGIGAASSDEFDNSKYQNRRIMNSYDRALIEFIQGNYYHGRQNQLP